MWTATYGPTSVGRKNPSRFDFDTREDADLYVLSRMCKSCMEERARVLMGEGLEFESAWPPCTAEWFVFEMSEEEITEAKLEILEYEQKSNVV